MPYSAKTGPGDRYVDALRFAIASHVEPDGTPQLRKGTNVPYLSHLLSVSALVWEAGGDEDQAIAGLLHDTIEDTDTTAEELRELFGAEVARLVVACSDGDAESDGQSPPRDATTWRSRKEACVAHLEQTDIRPKLVTAADKLHNATAIVTDAESDIEEPGEASVWVRFNASPTDIVWYYEAVLAALRPDLDGTPLLRRLIQAVERMKELAPR